MVSDAQWNKRTPVSTDTQLIGKLLAKQQVLIVDYISDWSLLVMSSRHYNTCYACRQCVLL